MSMSIIIKLVDEKPAILNQEAQKSLINVQNTKINPNLIAKWQMDEYSQLNTTRISEN